MMMMMTTTTTTTMVTTTQKKMMIVTDNNDEFIQSLFEGAMYIFVFMWTPKLGNQTTLSPSYGLTPDLQKRSSSPSLTAGSSDASWPA